MQSPHTILYWGGRNSTDFDLFADYASSNKSHLVFSREKDGAYVQDLLTKRETEVVEFLKNQGTVMICGSLTMWSGVQQQLESLTASFQLPSVDELKKQGKILVDCY